LATLLRFRQELYDSLGLRQDSLFELVDAVLTAPQRSTLVRLSLSFTVTIRPAATGFTTKH